MSKQLYNLANAKTIYIQSQKKSIALTVLENHPNAVTVLFYPGTMASAFMYCVLLTYLHEKGCNVVGIHPVGHGLRSDKKTIFYFDDILQNGLDAQAWAESYFSGPLVVSGHSQGGVLALAHALDNEKISACFPLGTLLPHCPDAILATRFAFMYKRKDLVLKITKLLSIIFPFFPIPAGFYLKLKKIFAHSYRIYTPPKSSRLSYPLAFLNSFFHKNLQLAQEAGHILCPLFLVTAKNDQLFTWEMMEKTFHSIQAPQKKLIPIAGGGHLYAISKHYAKHIASYIASECAGLGLPIYIEKKKEF